MESVEKTLGFLHRQDGVRSFDADLKDFTQGVKFDMTPNGDCRKHRAFQTGRTGSKFLTPASNFDLTAGRQF